MNENQNLLDLCRLNLLEEKIEDSVHPDADVFLSLIERKKRKLVVKIKGEQKEG